MARKCLRISVTEMLSVYLNMLQSAFHITLYFVKPCQFWDVNNSGNNNLKYPFVFARGTSSLFRAFKNEMPVFISQLRCSEKSLSAEGGYSESYLAQICMEKKEDTNIFYSFPFLVVVN